MPFPGPVRAVVGLLASAADEAKQLPERAIELPMLAVSTALQMSLRAQQRYARLAARGDEVLSRRPITEDPPPWASFDDPVTLDDRSDGSSAGPPKTPPAKKAPTKTPAKGTVAQRTPAQKTPAQKTQAQKTPATKTVAQKTPAKKTVTPKTPGKNAPAAANGPSSEPATDRSKPVSRPRHTAPSRFDTVGDD